MAYTSSTDPPRRVAENVRIDPLSPRERRRRQVTGALWTGLLIQAALTGIGLWVTHRFGSPLASLRGHALWAAATSTLLLPSWIGGFTAGLRLPFLRWWHLAAGGAAAAALFLALSREGTGGLNPLFRAWIAVQLVAGPLIGGWPGYWLRHWLRRPRPEAEPGRWGV